MRRFLLPGVYSIVLLVAFGARDAAAQLITVTSETRSISGSASGNFGITSSFDDTASAPSVLFNDSQEADKDDSSPQNDWSYSETATASQDSVDSSTSLFASGSAEATGTFNSGTYTNDSGNVSADSSYQVSFTVSKATTLVIDGFLEIVTDDWSSTAGDEDKTVDLQLSTPMQTIHEVSETMPGSHQGVFPYGYEQSISFSTMLQPSTTYTLDLDCSGDAMPQPGDGIDYLSGESIFNISATVPEPGTALAILGVSAAFLRRRRSQRKDKSL